MNIVVLGAGAVGGYFGAKLAKAGYSVQFLVRKNRYEQLRERGLQIESVHGNFTIQPQLILSTFDIEVPQLVIVALKNYHLQAALPQISALVRNGAIVLPLLNGVQHMNILLDAYGSSSVLGGTCYIETTLNPMGDIIHTSSLQHVVFGQIGDGISESFLSQVEDAFRKSTVQVTASSSIMIEMWKKYLFLCTFSAITATTRQPIGVVRADPVTLHFLEDLIAESVSVANANGIELPEHIQELLMQQFLAVPASMTSSLHRDLEKGLRLEIDSIQGAMIEMGRTYGIPTPSLAAVFALLHPYKDGLPS
ncbi:ketopantoate reductase family protein [Sulfoacidibacillus ferrooxidans]|uniref:2-dehydropantoate 2-reductase n=1 Tax=Sulfoacidibacillus ferrooxidans TaxID=2005001 RepID=A0A9X1V6K2_9BACL|nr:ketopantoate reductase family protein [Sulfoacidibacillus ferrooxidans]MCI0182219.1 putative 2-dehydropantoate 2-reductase [Sulfoacidibacillus ferrooxidans]